MEGRNLFRPIRLLWFCVTLLLLADPTTSSATGKKVTPRQRDETSSITLHVPIPMLALREVMNVRL